MITYKIPKFEEDVAIPDSIVEYLRGIGTIDEMVARGIITDKIAGIVRSELGNQMALTSNNIKLRDSRKSKAFQLFNEGKRPSDFEVKALGIKPESAYRYYQDWKKAR